MSILTYENKFYSENYSRNSTLIDEYKANMLVYLSKMFPEKTEDELDKAISLEMKNRYKPTNVKYINLPSKGNVEIKDGTLLDVTNAINDVIVTPYGATYVPTSVRESLFIPVINDDQAERKIVKKEMLLAEAKGDDQTAMIKHLRQLNIKIRINVLSGVMLANVAFRSGINYNSITSTVRFSIMLAYSYSEVLLEGNMYFANEDKGINWIVNLLRVYPGESKFKECVDKYKLAIPDTEKVSAYFCKHVNTYSKFSKNIQLKKLIASLSPLELAFVYYACNLKNIFQENDQFKIYFKQMFDITRVPENTSVSSIGDLPDGIVFTLAIVMLADDMIGSNGKSITLDVVDKDYPELAKKIISLYFYLEEHLNKLDVLMRNLILLPIVPSEIVLHKNMVRRTTLLSDTDSILFTTVNWIKWFTDDVRITTAATNMNAGIIAIMSKALEHIFAYSSASMNVAEKDIKELDMKNEFNYDIFMRTPISKHYAGYVRFREGLQQKPYKFDLKGKNFKGSDLCKTTTKYVEKFIRDIFDSYLETYEISGVDLLLKTIRFEQRIKKSIENGDVTFLGQQPIKLERDYKNPNSSNFIYYTMWMDIFSGDYPEINLPQKCLALPISEISMNKLKPILPLKESHPDIFEKFCTFLAKYPKRKFSRVLIPMDIPIPEELRSIADYRKVVATNCFSIYLVLKCFNIVNYTGGKSIVLFSDIYKSLLQEVLTDDKV